MRFATKNITFLLLLLFGKGMAQQSPSAQIQGQDQESRPIITAVPFLTIAPDARSAGMGDVGVATSPDVNSQHWNPAKLAFLDKSMGVSLSFTPWLQKIVGDMSLSYLSAYKKLNKNQAVGVSLRYFDLGSMEFTDANRNVFAEFNPREFAFDASFSMKLSDRFSIAGVGRFVHSNLSGNITSGPNTNDTRPGNTAAVDFAAYYRNEEVSLGGRSAVWSAGVNLSNIGFKIAYSDENQEDFIPTNLRLGTALTTDLDAYNKISLAFDINKLLVPTPPVLDSADNVIAGRTTDRSLLSGVFGSFSDAPDGFSEELNELIYSVGIEYWYNNLFALRGGYFHEHERKGNRQYYTVGLGLRYQVFGLDFAYLIARQRQNPLEDTIRFTLLINLDKQQESETAPSDDVTGF